MRDKAGGKYFCSRLSHKPRERARGIRLALWETALTPGFQYLLQSIDGSAAQWFGPNWPSRG